MAKDETCRYERVGRVEKMAPAVWWHGGRRPDWRGWRERWSASGGTEREEEEGGEESKERGRVSRCGWCCKWRRNGGDMTVAGMGTLQKERSGVGDDEGFF